MISKQSRASGRTAMAAALAGLVAAVLATALAAAPAEAGWIAVEKNGSTTIFSDGRMKMTYPGGEMMLSSANSELTVVDPANHLYAVASTDEYCSAASQLVDEMIAGVPAEQRAMMEKMMGRDASGKSHQVMVTESGTEKLLGFETTRYHILVDGAPYQDVWVTSDESLRKDTAALGKISGQLTACLKTMGKGTAPEGSREYAVLMDKGLPLRILVYQPNGATQTILEMTSLAAKDVSPDEFRIPEGYQKAPLADMIRAQWGTSAAGSNPHAANPQGADPHAGAPTPHQGNSPH